MLSGMAGHRNKLQKLSYIERIREENTKITNERNLLQSTNAKLLAKIKLVEEDLRYYRSEKPHLYSVRK